MPSTTLTIDEVYGGGGNSGAVYKNDYVVLHNETNAAINLAGYSIQYASATGAAWQVNSLKGSIAAGGYFLIQEAAGAGGSANLPTPDYIGGSVGTETAINMSGTTGKVALVLGTTALNTANPAGGATVVDLVGYGAAAGYEGAPTSALTNTTSAVRANNGNTDTDNNAADFTTSSTPGPASHVPFNSASAPHAANGGGATSLGISSVSQNEGDAGTTPFIFTVTRSGDLTGVTTVNYATADGSATVADADYAAAAGTLTFAAGVATQSVTVLVNGDTKVEPNETFTVNLSNPTAGVTFSQQAGTGTIVNDDVTLVGIADIQGASQTSPFTGATVTTQGVVTYVKTGSGGGFYIQDTSPLGPAGASHGLFVFTNNTPAVTAGDAVTVTGLVTEYQAGNNNLSTTELNNPTFTVSSHNNAITPVIIGTGGVLPPTQTIAPATPYNPATSGADFYESLEGQIVTIHNAQAVDATYSGSTWVVADNGAEVTGLNARGGVTVSATDFNPERIQIYSTALNATIGEHLGDITGVLTYFSSNDAEDPNIGGEYELIPTAPITPPGGQSATAPPAPALPTTALQGDASHVSIAAYNVDNLGPVEPGVAQATVDARFALLGKDIAQNLRAPDILGLEEIQDSDGQGAGTDLSAAVTLNKLIAAIAAAGGPTYQYVEIAPTTANTNGGATNGNIRTAYLYNPARVSYVAGSAQLISDPNLADGDAFANSRKPLAAQFVFNGQTINAIDVHDYARLGSQELYGANQPPINSGDQRRIDQTAAVNAYVNQLLAANPNANVTVQGDFNGFQFEQTLTQLTHAGGGQLTQLSDLLPANERYSTTFEGDSQEIDHLLVSDSLDPGAAFDIVHLNTGQTAANQASDHDPIVSLLAVAAPPKPAVSGAVAGQAAADNAASSPFAAVVVTDASPTAAETVTVTLSAAANGVLAGGGFVQTSPGVYTVAAASAAAAQADLRALVFTPTANQVAPGRTVTTGFTIAVNDGAAQATDATTMVVVASVNDAPALGGLQAAASAPVDATVTLQPNVTLSDPDVGAMVAGATVAIAAPTNGDRLSVTATAGIASSYNATTGVLTLSGAASDLAYQQALRSVTYLHDGTTDAGSRTITFAVTDDQGATARATETVSVAGYTQPATGGAASVPTNLDVQQAFPTQTSNLLRASANDPALQTPTSPLYAQAQAEKAIAAQLDSGQIGLADAQNALYHLVDGTVSVAEISYAFFTGKTPTAAGLGYLVHSAANPTDLNDPYYAQFSTENRYINFGVNLATGGGAGAAAFQAGYGALSLSDATAKAYTAVFGFAPAAGKVDAILGAQVSNGLGGTETRAQYLADITGGGALAQKAAVVGFLLADSVKEGFGAYQQADLHFLADLAHGTAVYNVDLLAAYTAPPALVGLPVADTSLGG